jgi:hypothetical protein
MAGTVLSTGGNTLTVNDANATISAQLTETQTVVIGGTPTGGTYTLSGGPLTGTTGTIPYNGTALQVQTALQAVAPAGCTVTVTQTGSSPNFTNTVTFTGLTASATALTYSTAGLTGGSPTITVTITVAWASANPVAVFWFVGSVMHAVYDVVIASITSPGSAETIALTMTGAKYLVSGDAALPANETAITIGVAQILTQATDGVTIPGTTIQQLIATSNQPGMVEWLNATPVQDRLSAFTIGGQYDTWPTQLGQSAPPTGGSGSLSWTAGDVVTSLRFFNQATSAATMQAGALLL